MNLDLDKRRAQLEAHMGDDSRQSLIARIEYLEAALTAIQRGDYDNAHDCKAASRCAADALAGRWRSE